jgi:hypothetical protein
MNQDEDSLAACPGGNITPPSARCSRSWEARLAAREADWQAVAAVGILWGMGVVMVVAAAIEVVELGREVPGLHVVATPGKAGSSSLQLGGDEFEVMLEVVDPCLFLTVSYDLSVCCPVG